MSLASRVIFLVPPFSFRSCADDERREIPKVSNMMQLNPVKQRHQQHTVGFQIFQSVSKAQAYLVGAVSVPVPFFVSWWSPFERPGHFSIVLEAQ